MTTRKQLDQEYHQRIVAENDELGAEVKRLTDDNAEIKKELHSTKLSAANQIESYVIVTDGLKYQRQKLEAERDAMRNDLEASIWPINEYGRLEYTTIPPSARTQELDNE